MKINTTGVTIGIFVVVISGLLIWSYAAKTHDPSIVASRGLHWHAQLAIIVAGEATPIPEGIGLLATGHLPMHTHDASGEIHMEFGGVVHHQDLTLGHLFDEWGKPIDSFGTNMYMTVNGATSTAYGAYEMRDGDVIVLTYD